MEIWGLLKIIFGSVSVIGVLVFIHRIYRWGYEKGKRETEEKTLIFIAQNNRQLLKGLYNYVSNPNSMFKLPKEGD